MSQLALLDIPPMNKGKTCRNCKHRQRWRCGNSVIMYCGILQSKRTMNGLLKIRVTDPACNMFEVILEKQK